MTDESLQINATWLNDRGGIKINATWLFNKCYLVMWKLTALK